MAGGNTPKPSAAAATHRKSRWESTGKKLSSDPKPGGTSGSGSVDPKSKPSPKPKTPTPNHPIPKPINNPSPKPDPSAHFGLPPFPFRDPPPPPQYGFHLLERRTIVLADGSVRSYCALPPDYQDFPPFPRLGPGGPGFGLPMSPPNRNHPDYWIGLEGGGQQNAMKRKFGAGDEGLERLRQQVLEHGNASGAVPPVHGASNSLFRGGGEEIMIRPAKHMRMGGFEGGTSSGGSRIIKHNEVDQSALKKSYLLMVKLIYENANLKRNYLADGKQGRLQCLACNRNSKDFPDMHSLIMHAYNSDNADSLVEHLAFHKALCVLMGWNYLTLPDNSKSYQILSSDEAAANRDDLILWPPLVIIHNTITVKRADGRMEGLGNKAMDRYLRDIGIHGGKAKTLYSREGHLGITLVKFTSDQSGLMEAMRLAEYFEKENRGRKVWARLPPLTLGKDDENNPDLFKVDHRTGEKKRVFYGYLGTVSDLEKVDFDSRKKIVIASRCDYKPSG